MKVMIFDIIYFKLDFAEVRQIFGNAFPQEQLRLLLLLLLLVFSVSNY